MSRNRTASLEDILRILPLDAKDTIVNAITMQRWDNYPRWDGIMRTRLACRALRDLVDGSCRIVHLVLRCEDKERLASGQLPPLHRWPRCSRVRLRVSSDLQPSTTGAMIGLAVGGLQLEARQRITELCLPGDLPATAVTSALMFLPALQSVSFRSDLPGDPLELRYVFHGLASLLRLTELQISIGPAVHYLPMLAGSNLSSLHVLLGDDVFQSLDENMIASISRLDKLQRLCMSIDDTDLLRLLMRSLPPTIQNLQLSCCDVLCENYLDPETTEVQFHQGFISAIESDYASFGRLAQLVCKMARGASNGAITVPPPKSFHVRRLLVTGSEVGTGPDAVALKQLLQRCADVEVKTLVLQEAVTPKWAMDLAPLLGGTKELTLWLRDNEDLDIRTEALWPAVAAAAGEEEDGAGAVQPVGPSLVELALDRMAAAGADAAGPSAAAKGVPQSACDVLLRGPSLASLTSDPDALKDCMQRLAAQAQAQAGAAAAATAAALVTAPPEQCCVLSYLALPPPPPSRSTRRRGAVLVRCTTPAAAAALAQAAAVMAAAGTLGAGTGGAGEPAGELLAQPVALQDSDGQALDVCCLQVVKQAAQDVCDGKGPGAGWSGRQRLQWLLEEWVAVRDWPQTVRMN